MAGRINKKSYRIKAILSFSNINNTDFFQLILCMLVSHSIIKNPLYGAALFLFANNWILYFQGNLRKLAPKNNKYGNLSMWVLLSISVVLGQALIFFYPLYIKNYQANYVSFFVLLIAARTIFTYRFNASFSRPKTSHRRYKTLFQLIFIGPCALFAYFLLDVPSAWFTVVGFTLTGLLVSQQIAPLVSFGKYVAHLGKDKMGGISSYRIFSNMSLYSQTAFCLAILMYLCYVSFTPQSLHLISYAVMVVWLMLVLVTSEVFTWVANKRGFILNANLFVIGAFLWSLGSVKMYDTSGFWMSGLWTLFWGIGIASISSVLSRYNGDFKMVARIVDRRVSDRDLYFHSMLTQIIAVITSNTIMLLLLTVWTFVLPAFNDVGLSQWNRRIMMQLPVLFMIIGVIFALKQPLDERSRQKLLNYERGTSKNNLTKQNLEKRLIAKSRVRFGIKIIAAAVRPFLRLKVEGRENLNQEDFPSILVCNHGIIYGPIAAVIYLPTYFRPWIDRKMVDRDMAAREMYGRFIYRIPLFSPKAKLWMAKQLSRPVTWALNSFNPIPVERDNLRNLMSTFNDTVEVLSEGDNVLIFPERPKHVERGRKMTVKHETDTVGTLFTGFANIGKMYYDKTGKELKFYPIYANKKTRTFRIGSPVTYNPHNDPRDEKIRIAEALRENMLKLREHN